jgi:large subunit ribosomal protein L9
MKVILQRDIPKVGHSGDIVEVKDGYARNYLFPRRYAVAATGGALREYKARLAREQEREVKQRESAASDAEKLKEVTLILTAKVGSGTKLFGSITAQDVADAIQKECGITVDKRRIGLADPIKNLGRYTIPVRLLGELSVNVHLEVVTEEELERRKEQAVAEAAAAEAAKEVTTPEEAANA